MAREIKPDEGALCALRFIMEFALSADQIKYRYTVKQIDLCCAELGLSPIDGEKEDSKVKRLVNALNDRTMSNVVAGSKTEIADAAREAWEKQIAAQNSCC